VDLGSGPVPTRLQITVSEAHLRFWVHGTTAHPSSTAKAFLVVALCYQTLDLPDPTTCFNFRGAALQLRTAGAPPLSARNIGDDQHSVPAWEVPASFTSGTITIDGTETSADGGFRLTITKPFTFPVSF
jgi:hypothetical protein